MPYKHGLFNYPLVCRTAGPYALPKRNVHRVRSSAFSFNFLYPLCFLRSFSRFLRLLSRLSFTSILPSIFPSMTCFRIQFVRKIWPIHSAFIHFIICRKWTSSLSLFNISSFLSRSVQLIFPILLQYHILKLFRYIWSTILFSLTKFIQNPCWFLAE
jgi:hypothetical protein